ncbi:MAG: 3-hydroxyacyl-CoA dehydrogenase/enoyl-CoA hydratase family protein [Thermodesulfobacteriota bacterium]
MKLRIKKAAVLGAGVMGSAIAAHLANVGIPTFLLDMVPLELTEEEKRRGLTFEHLEVRNRFSLLGKKRVQESRPSSLYLKEEAELITIGNFEDHLSWISQVDWIIEVIIEEVKAKKSLLKRLIPYLKEDTVISSNTSGISIRKMVEDFPKEFEERFLGTHFFNPPRYMKLLELIPSPSTNKEILEGMAHLGERILGKGVVFAKDTPSFIANRIGTFASAITIRTMIEEGYKVEEVDQITGTAMGRPKQATFRLADLVGLDVVALVSKNLYESLPPGEREYFAPTTFIQYMLKNQWLGDKTKQGFYKKLKREGKDEVLVFDYETLDYRPQIRVTFPSVEMVKNIEDVGERIKTLVTSQDRAGQFAWKVLKKILLYSAEKIPEISDDIINVDRAMRWGYNWEIGPFEQWDAIGVPSSVKRMEKEGEKIPQWVEDLLHKGYTSFYEKREGRHFYFDRSSGQYGEIEEKPQIIILPSLKERKRTVLSNPGASLIDLGEGVACLEFHSKMNTIGPDTIQMMKDSLKVVEEKFEGLVIGNQGGNFSAGANLMLILFEIQDENWEGLEASIKAFQDTLMALKYFEKPVVAAPFGLTLAGGCEICLAASQIRASAETYMGLVEVGVGLIPAGGGTKEMLLRSIEAIPPGVETDLFPFVRKAFETVAMGKVSTSAKEAQQLGYMRRTDQITINRDYLLHDAKQTVLHLIHEGYRPPRPKPIKLLGEKGYALLQMGLFLMKEGGYISEYDQHVTKKVAYIMTGGNLPDGTEVTEQHLLDLEREAFLSLCGEPKTQERIEYMLKRGKPLRN